MISLRFTAIAIGIMTVMTAAARADDADEPAAPRSQRQWQVEFKRAATNRGSESETTKTTLRIETLADGPLASLRLDLPLPDEKTDFDGSPFQPRLGDIKVKAGFKSFGALGMALSPTLELTLPTADPDSLGSGKYQLALGMQASMRLPVQASHPHAWSVISSIQQVMSIAGDASRKDINYTKFELGLRDTWHKDYSVKLTFKPVIDWEQSGKTGAVAELEWAHEVSSHWRVALTGGGLLWGAGVPGTYGSRLELGVRHRF